jgi:hypothetical protein
MNWLIASMDYNVSQDGHTNVITVIHWTVSKTSGEHTASSYGTVALEPPGETFVEWADITEETAVGWVQTALGAEQITAIEASIDAQIAEQATPTKGSSVPWGA